MDSPNLKRILTPFVSDETLPTLEELSSGVNFKENEKLSFN
jgi:hypothetical protein